MEAQLVKEIKKLSKKVYFALLDGTSDERHFQSLKEVVIQHATKGRFDEWGNMGIPEQLELSGENLLTTQETVEVFTAFLFVDWRDKNHGGTREGSGRKPTFGEPSTTIAFRVPVSKTEEIKEVVGQMLDGYRIEKPETNPKKT